MQFDSDIVEIKFTGNEIKPDKVSLEEAAKILVSFKKLVEPILLQQNPNIDLESTYVGLVDIGDRSFSFRYVLKQHQKDIRAAVTTLLVAISTHSIAGLPDRTLAELDSISTFNKKWGTRTALGEVIDSEFSERANFFDEYQKEKIPTIQGNTVAYGKIITVGHTDPHLSVKLISGETISVFADEATIVNWRPYTWVRVEGVGVWHSKELVLKRVNATKIEEYKRVKASEGFDFLRETLGPYWDNIDPQTFLND